ncbi:TPA: hypothetical protein ACUI23_001819 [Staphylococcus pseudintermedius]
MAETFCGKETLAVTPENDQQILKNSLILILLYYVEKYPKKNAELMQYNALTLVGDSKHE